MHTSPHPEFERKIDPYHRKLIDRILDDLDEERGTKLRAALAARQTVSGATIARVLTEWGYPIERGAVQAWRATNQT